jgi:hypothetical protein
LSQSRLFPFRVINWSWGIAIDILAQALAGSPVLPEDIPVGFRTWARILPPLSQEARDSLVTGLARVSALIEQAVPEGPIVIEIERVDYVPTDYQPEGLEAAIIGWATEEFASGSEGRYNFRPYIQSLCLQLPSHSSNDVIGASAIPQSLCSDSTRWTLGGRVLAPDSQTLQPFTAK